MIKNKQTLFFCYPPKITEPDTKKKTINNYNIVFINENMIIWPKKISISTCAPENMVDLKKNIQTKTITIFDQIKNSKNIVNICGHVNRAGTNFLVGKTPFLNKQQFPDMSNIYTTKTAKSKIVHTIGQQRFSSGTKLMKNTIWSESIGLISPVFSYLGFYVTGVGIPEHEIDNININQFLN